MKKKVLLLILIISAFFSVTAQPTVDPADYFYNQAQIWYVRGLVKQLPPLRPYSKASINEILNTVIENGNEKDIQIAKDYYETINNKKWYVALQNEGYVTYEKELNKMFSVTPSIYGDLSLYEDLLSLGYKIGFVNKTDAEDAYLSMYQSYNHNTTYDAAIIGPFNSFLDTDEALSFGNTSIFGQGGIYRSSYGSFLGDNLAISENNSHTGNFSFSFLRPKFSYVQQLSILGASHAYDGTYLSPNKYNAFHEITLHLFDKLDFTYYETMVYGKRFEFVYLLPVVYMAGQGIGGYDDNLQMGVSLNYRPVNQLMLSFDSFVDDIDVNKLVKFNFQGRQRFAIKTGINYSPDDLFFTKAELNYTLITPYTYSHYQGDEENDLIQPNMFNYQDCTNFGHHIGTVYDPNSDAINLNFDFNPVNKLILRFNNSFVRHGNVCENYSPSEALYFLKSAPGTYATDGSIYNHQIWVGAQNVIPTAQDYLNLLNQNHIMYVVKSGITADYELPKFWKTLTASFQLGYTFQYVHNNGVGSNLFPGGEIILQNDGTYLWKGDNKYHSAAEIDAMAEEITAYYMDKWIAGLSNLFTNYFTLGVTIKF